MKCSVDNLTIQIIVFYPVSEEKSSWEVSCDRPHYGAHQSRKIDVLLKTKILCGLFFKKHAACWAQSCDLYRNSCVKPLNTVIQNQEQKKSQKIHFQVWLVPKAVIYYLHSKQVLWSISPPPETLWNWIKNTFLSCSPIVYLLFDGIKGCNIDTTLSTNRTATVKGSNAIMCIGKCFGSIRRREAWKSSLFLLLLFSQMSQVEDQHQHWESALQLQPLLMYSSINERRRPEKGSSRSRPAFISHLDGQFKVTVKKTTMLNVAAFEETVRFQRL